MWKKCLLIVLLGLLVVVLLAACGGTSAPARQMAAATSAPQAVKATVVVKETAMVELVVTAAPQPTMAPVEGEAVAAVPGVTLPRQTQAGRMIIKNAELDLLVADTDVALDGITGIAADYGAISSAPAPGLSKSSSMRPSAWACRSWSSKTSCAGCEDWPCR